MRLYKGDCLEVMKEIESGSIDAIITDPPYGTTACKWDSVIDFKLMWEQLNRIIKPNGAIVLFGSEPFSSALRMSNINNYKYDWIWEKSRGSNFMLAKKQPLKYHEQIHIFYKKQPKYNPIMRQAKPHLIDKRTNLNPTATKGALIPNRKLPAKRKKDNGLRYPKSVINFKSCANQVHPTQKPVLLMEYLIKTYTNENETVLDFTMGSGSTGVACVNTNRKFVGIEMDSNYFEIAEQRIKEANYKLF
jgi:DNA modification methylase